METNNKIFEKKTDSFSTNWDNFSVPGELTVTITLNEYRELVRNNATRQQAIDDAKADKWARDNENKNLKEENSKLKNENYDLKKAVDSLNDQLAAAIGKESPFDA